MRKELLLGVLVTVVGCEDTIHLDPMDNTPPREAEVRPPPISGGTLAIAGDFAVAADPDRDRVSIVNLITESVKTIDLEEGDEPGRVIQGSEGTAHVVLRGGGALLTIDTEDASIVARRDLCTDPRGLALHPGEARIYVACSDGTLVDMPEVPGAAHNRAYIEPDLRDVLIIEGNVFVTTFRSAEIISASASGGSNRPQNLDDRQPHVAWRTVVDSFGRTVMLHELSTTRPVPIEPTAPDDVGDSGFDDGGGGGSPYGGGGFCEPGVNEPALTVFDGFGSFTVPQPTAGLAVDVAISPSGEFFAMATPGAGPDDPVAGFGFLGDGAGCFEFGGGLGPHEDGQVTSVAWTNGSKLVMQSREPARLFIQASDEPFDMQFSTVELGGDSMFDTGHELFHRKTSAGVSCAGCHPEGTDDGHVWNFETLGKRRTQPLDVGLRDTAPFHWDGDMDSFGTLVEEVFSHRMGGQRQSKARTESFANYLFELRRPAADAALEPVLADQGKTLFAAYGCSSCHSGDNLSNNTTVTIGGADLQVPSLRRVALRPPFMHDGRVGTLEDAVWDMLDETVEGHAATSAEVTAISEYLRSR